MEGTNGSQKLTNEGEVKENLNFKYSYEYVLSKLPKVFTSFMNRLY